MSDYNFQMTSGLSSAGPGSQGRGPSSQNSGYSHPDSFGLSGPGMGSGMGSGASNS